MAQVAKAIWYAAIHHALQVVRSGWPGPSAEMVEYIDAHYGLPPWERA